jgi:hypothetical protein
MSRDALPPVPSVIGTPAKYTPATFTRKWPERRQTYVVPVHPEPLVRSYALGPDDEEFLPTNARSLARRAAVYVDHGWSVDVTYALGYDMNEDGTQATDDIMEFTGGMTAGSEKRAPQPERRKIGEVLRPAQHSIRVDVRTDGDRDKPWRFVGHWLNDGWAFGLTMAGPFGNVLASGTDWRALWKAFKDAESEKNLRWEKERAELSIHGHQGTLL